MACILRIILVPQYADTGLSLDLLLYNKAGTWKNALQVPSWICRYGTWSTVQRSTVSNAGNLKNTAQYPLYLCLSLQDIDTTKRPPEYRWPFRLSKSVYTVSNTLTCQCNIIPML